jgi:hypothetical protein
MPYKDRHDMIRQLAEWLQSCRDAGLGVLGHEALAASAAEQEGGR